MKKYDIVIIGGGPAGIVTAMTAQKEYRDKSILIITAEEKALVPCGIPYMFHELGNVEKNRMSPQAFVNGGGKLLIDTVIAIDSQQQVLTVSSTDKISYDKLVFATEINKTVFASAGAIEQEAERADISYITSSFSDVDRHPGTFPDAKKLTVKLVVMPEDGQIIGGEVVGSKSSAELINVIALAIQKYVTVYELISFQIGSHPLLSGAPTKTALIKAAENAIRKISQLK
jgi:pyruvate/2-oxoglutarate dehydrogenase complex dihydrolipoamide dehydrogenase (E3) component